MRATRILIVLLGLACTTGLSISACSDDDSGGKGTDKDPSTGDGDGDGDGDDADDSDDGDGIIIPGVDGGTGDGDGDDDGDGPQCQDGQTQECTCADGTSKGEQYCFQGMYQGGCTNCPCNDGDVQSCICQGVGLGQQVCEGTSYGECVCDTSDGGVGGPCPESLTCQDLMGMGAVCVDPNAQSPIPGFSLPATCETTADCTAAGYDNAACNSVQFISDILLMGQKLCVQQCTPEPTTP